MIHTNEAALLELSTTDLQVANRADPKDMFGLLSVKGYVVGQVDDRGTLTVDFAGHTCTLPAAQVMWPQSENTRCVEFHLLTHLATNGVHNVSAKLHLADGTQLDFPALSLNICNDGPLAHQVSEDLRAFNTPLITGRIIDSSLFPYGNGTARAWFNDAAVEDVPLSFEPAGDATAAQRHLLRWGFCVLHEQLPNDLIESFNRDLENAIATGELQYRAGSSDRIHGAHRKIPAARAVWLYPPVIDFLESFFKDTPCACQTLTYVNGSEQDAHQDSIHLTPYPSGFMCGVWIALQDIEADSGELFVYPGSHRSGSIRARDLGVEKIINEDYSPYHVFATAIDNIIEQEGYEKVVYRPKAGQILVWHENLIHGGSPRADQNRSRLSVVSHYYAKGSVGFYDSRGEAAALETLAKM
ncbi:phytanoyl-CoA dioxygenase family protein (plasmid) [Novosphingobium sp. BL-8H]|uniref:phytanoyl-CoA dioxygenase family protein n=1 Tax=Novosphingobium sp. BL-8H TaxID=3127640 RepID=UPI0037581D7B